MAVVGYFPSTLAVDSNTGTRLRNAEAQVYAMTDTSFSSPLAITDVAGVPITGNKLVSNSDGIYPEFKPPAGVTQVIVKSGQALTPMTDISVSAAAAETAATNAATSAGTATTAAGAASTSASSAATAAAQAVAVGNTNDTIIEGRIKDSTSKTAVALKSTIDARTVDARGRRIGSMIVSAVGDVGDAAAAKAAYGLGNYSLSAGSTASNDWLFIALTPDGKQLICIKNSTKELGFSLDEGATITSAEVFPKQIRDVRLLPSGRLLVAVADDGGVCDFYRSGTDWRTNPVNTVFTKVFTSTEVSVWPAYLYSGITDDGGTTVWAVLYGAKTNVSPGSSRGASKVLRSTDDGATWTVTFDLWDWLVARGKSPSTWGYHLHGVVYDPYWDRVWVSFGDSSGSNGLNGVVYSDDRGTTWVTAYTNESIAALGYVGDRQGVGMWPMPGGLVIQNDGNPAYVYTLPRYGYRVMGDGGPASNTPLIRDAQKITSLSGSPSIGGKPFQQSYPGAPLLLPVTQQATQSSGASLSRVIATGDGIRFYDLFTDPGGPVNGFDGVLTALGPTVSGKILGTRRGPSSTLQRWVAQL